MFKQSSAEHLPVHNDAPSSSSNPENRPRTRNLHPAIGVLLGEFIGTFLFLFIAFSGTQIALGAGNGVDSATLVYIAFSFGFGLAVNVAIFADVSGGMFNPAVTVALLLTRKIKYVPAIVAIIAQIIAAIAAAGLVAGLLPGPLSVNTTLHPTCSVVRGLFIEVFVTAQLILIILVLEGGPSKPAYIGLTLFVAELSSVFFTGGSLNPARSFGPAVVVDFPGHHWIYWIGPLLGAGIGSAVYLAIAYLRKGSGEAR